MEYTADLPQNGAIAAKQEPVQSTLTLRGRELQIETKAFDTVALRFYVANPRIYSIVHQAGQEPTQDEIEEQLLLMEHVRELIVDIKRNGGLIEPVIVKPETLEVLEGNSRLAAYRKLYKENPVKWNKMKCTFLPEGLDDKTIFSLLGQYHIKGKKDWAPYEQAGFIYRRFKEHGLTIDEVAKEIGLKAAEAKLFVDTYQFMDEHDDNDASKWSYYYEYLKSRKIKKAREKFGNFDDLVVSKIKSGEIDKAVDVRDQLTKIVDGPANVLKRFVNSQVNFKRACEIIQDSGADNTVYKRLERTRLWLAEDEVKKALQVATVEERRRIVFELTQIEGRIKVLKSKY